MMYYLVSAEDVSNKKKIDIPCEIVKKRKVSDSPNGKRKIENVTKKATSTPINKGKKKQTSMPIINHGHRRYKRDTGSL